MDYRKDRFPLNHFVLWAKGWYHKVHNDSKDKNTKLYEELKSVLALDGYSTHYMNVYDMCRTISNVFEEYNYWCRSNNLSYMRITELFNNINRYKEYGYNDSEAIIMAFRSYFQNVEAKNIKLSAPHYSKKLYKKLDLVKGNLFNENKNGVTYKEMNNIVKEFKWDFPYEEINFNIL